MLYILFLWYLYIIPEFNKFEEHTFPQKLKFKKRKYHFLGNFVSIIKTMQAREESLK